MFISLTLEGEKIKCSISALPRSSYPVLTLLYASNLDSYVLNIGSCIFRSGIDVLVMGFPLWNCVWKAFSIVAECSGNRFWPNCQMQELNMQIAPHIGLCCLLVTKFLYRDITRSGFRLAAKKSAHLTSCISRVVYKKNDPSISWNDGRRFSFDLSCMLVAIVNRSDNFSSVN